MSELIKSASPRRRSAIVVTIAALLIASAALLPETAGLTYEGRMVLSILAAGVLLWVTEALPLAATALLVLVMMPITGVCSFSDAYANSIGSTVFFLMGTFAFTVALDATTIPTRVCGLVLRWAGNDSRKVVLGFMCACALLSLVMSDVAACGVFISVGKRLLELNGTERGKSRLGTTMMIAIPYASYAGGMACMAGNGCNVLTVSLFSSLFGVEMSFVQWMMIGVPFAVVMLVASWIFLCAWFKPEKISQHAVDETMREVSDLPKMQVCEWKTVGVIAAALVFWVASSWLSFLNTAEIAIVAMVLLSIPGWNPLDFKSILKRMNWDIILLIMCVISAGHFVVETGAGNWIVETIMAVTPDAMKVPLILMLVASFIGAVMHNVVPVGPAVAGILAFPLGAIAMDFGIPMYAMLMVVAWEASVSYILPLDCVPVLTYSTGYYSMGQYAKAGIIPTVFLIVFTSVCLPIICTLYGFI